MADPHSMKIGGRYNWRNQPERLIYIRRKLYHGDRRFWRKLWALLDDIDTLDDACRSDDAAFRKHARSVQRKRFDVLSGEQFDALAAAPSTPEKAGGVSECTKPACDCAAGYCMAWPKESTGSVPASDDCSSCGGSGSQGQTGCTDCLGTGVDPMSDRALGVSASVPHPLPAQANDGGKHA